MRERKNKGDRATSRYHEDAAPYDEWPQARPRDDEDAAPYDEWVSAQPRDDEDAALYDEWESARFHDGGALTSHDEPGTEQFRYDESLISYEDEETPLKKKRKKKRPLLRVLVALVCCAAAYLILTSSLFGLEVIQVKKEGGHYTEAQIIALTGIEKGTNLFKLRTGRTRELLLADPWIQSAEVQRDFPHGLTVQVKEKKETFLTPYEGRYLLVSDTGDLLAFSPEEMALPLVEGLDVRDVKPGEPLDVRDEKQLHDILNLLSEMKKEGLGCLRIKVSGLTPQAWLTDKLVVEGEWENLRPAMGSLKTVLADLQQKKVKQGTIRVSGNGTCSFSPKFSKR